MTQYDAPETPPVGQDDSPFAGRKGRGSPSFLDDVADDLGNWINDTANAVALAFAPGRAPFSANISEEQKLDYYKSRLFNPDGSPNAAGREAEFQRLGVQGFSQVYRALTARWPELRVPSPPSIEVPEQWPTAAPGPPQGPPGGPPAAPPVPPGVPGPSGPRPPMMPPVPPRR
jgi:hypothetical protein